MATLTIKNIPEAVYLGLKRQAALHRRSLNNEAIISLEQAVGRKTINITTVLNSARNLRAKTTRLRLTDKILHEAKNQGRP